MTKKTFKEDIEGADKLFSANDNPENAEVKNNLLSSILENIKEEPKGKNCTYYLTDEVSKAVIETAKKNNISNSKLVESILKKVLID